jgi:hypothetical protein
VRRPNLYIGTEFSRRFQGNFGDSSWCINWKFNLVILLLGWMQGKGVYQFVDKYGANVDGYRWACSASDRWHACSQARHVHPCMFLYLGVFFLRNESFIQIVPSRLQSCFFGCLLFRRIMCMQLCTTLISSGWLRFCLPINLQPYLQGGGLVSQRWRLCRRYVASNFTHLHCRN